MRNGKCSPLCLTGLVLLMALAGLASWWATRNGPGFEGNSIPYVSAARTFAQSGVMMVPNTNGEMEPLLLWPPLYPAAMGFGSKITGDVLTAGRWLNIFLLPLNILLLAWLGGQMGLAPIARAAICILFAFAPETLYAHVSLMSESITLFWWLATLNLLLLYSSKQTWAVLTGAAIAAAMTWMARFAGIAAIVSGVLFIAVVTSGSRGRRLGRAAVFGLVAVAPLQIWVHVLAHVSTLGTRHPGLYGFAPHQISSFLRALLRWLVPFDEMTALKFAVLAVFVAWLALTVPAVWRRRAAWFANEPEGTGLDKFGPALVVLNLLAVEGLIFFTGIFLDPTLDMGDRMHYFGFVFTLVLMGAMGTVLLRGALAGSQPWVRLLAAGLPVGIVLLYLAGGSQWIWQADEDHLTFNCRSWRESPTLAAVDSRYSHALIYTNQPAAIYLRTGRTDIRLVPYAYDKTRPTPLADFQSNFANMLHETAAHQGVIIYFYLDNFRAPLADVEKDPRLKVVQTFPDAIIFAPSGS